MPWRPAARAAEGLVPRRQPAAVLRGDLTAAGVAAPTDTLAQLLTSLPESLPGEDVVRVVTPRSASGATDRHHPYQPTSTGRLSMHQPAGHRGGFPAAPDPAWVGAVGPGTLVLIDEAGMAGTRDLAAAVKHVVDAGGSVRLVGDDQQLAAVAAGGILRDLAEQGYAHGTTATLTELHRFTDPEYADLTLLMRTGQIPGTVFDLLQARGLIQIHPTEVERLAALTDVHGTVIADTREQVATLNAVIRDQRLATGQTVRVPPLNLDAAPPRRDAEVSDQDARDLRDMVLHEDRDLIVLNKPFGLAVQGGSGTKHHVDGMLASLPNERGDRPLLVHRLDRDTSGVLLVARTRKMAADLGEVFRSRQAKKTYWALVEGQPKPAQGRISLYLAKGEGMGDVRGKRVDGVDYDAREKMRVARHGEDDAQHSVTYYATVDKVPARLAWLSTRRTNHRAFDRSIEAPGCCTRPMDHIGW